MPTLQQGPQLLSQTQFHRVLHAHTLSSRGEQWTLGANDSLVEPSVVKHCEIVTGHSTHAEIRTPRKMFNLLDNSKDIRSDI